MTDQTRHINPNDVGRARWLGSVGAKIDAAGIAGGRIDPAPTPNPFGPPVQRPPLADHEVCGAYAAEAIRQGRFELAAELSRLAARAQFAASRPAAAQRGLFGPGADRTRDVPLIGTTRDETPSRPLRSYREDLAEAISHAPTTCAHRTEINGSGTLCHQPVAWADGVGESGVQRQPAGWYHLDPEITDHEPIAAR